MTARELYTRIDDLLFEKSEEADEELSQTFDQYERALDEGKSDNELSAYLRFFLRARERANTIRAIGRLIHTLEAEIDE